MGLYSSDSCDGRMRWTDSCLTPSWLLYQSSRNALSFQDSRRCRPPHRAATSWLLGSASSPPRFLTHDLQLESNLIPAFPYAVLRGTHLSTFENLKPAPTVAREWLPCETEPCTPRIAWNRGSGPSSAVASGGKRRRPRTPAAVEQHEPKPRVPSGG